MIIPITLNSDSNKIIGYCHVLNSGIRVKFNKEANVNRDEFFKIFNCGAMIVDAEAMPDGLFDPEHYMIKEAEIMNFNLDRADKHDSEDHF